MARSGVGVLPWKPRYLDPFLLLLGPKDVAHETRKLALPSTPNTLVFKGIMSTLY